MKGLYLELPLVTDCSMYLEVHKLGRKEELKLNLKHALVLEKKEAGYSNQESRSHSGHGIKFLVSHLDLCEADTLAVIIHYTRGLGRQLDALRAVTMMLWTRPSLVSCFTSFAAIILVFLVLDMELNKGA